MFRYAKRRTRYCSRTSKTHKKLLFVACDIGKVSIEKISREVLPYVGGLIVTAILLVLFPQIVTWLPSLKGL